MKAVSYTHLDVYKRQGESNSISNQKRILETYAKQNGFSNLRWYTDDSYSGANFQRPGFQAMLADIEAGKVGTVIVKDYGFIRASSTSRSATRCASAFALTIAGLQNLRRSKDCTKLTAV